MAAASTNGTAKRPPFVRACYALSFLLVIAGAVLLTLLYTDSGAALKAKAFADGQHARIAIETRAVEGNLAVITPPSPPPPPQEETPPAEETETETETPAEETLGSEAALAETETAAEPVATAQEEPAEDAPPPPNVALPLKEALNDALLESVKGAGKLPVVSKSGEESWKYYGKPDTGDTAKPAIAIVVTGLGLSRPATLSALRLPENITLSFSPYAGQLQQQIARARAYGHEVWLDMPLEPEAYPASDAGPLTLHQALSAEEITERLHRVLAGSAAYVGLIGTAEEVFSEQAAMHEVAQELKRRGLLLMLRSARYARSETADHVLYVSRTLDMLPEGGGAADAEQMLVELETAARESGYAIGVLSDAPRLHDRIGQWAALLEGKGITLVPATAILARRKP